MGQCIWHQKPSDHFRRTVWTSTMNSSNAKTGARTSTSLPSSSFSGKPCSAISHATGTTRGTSFCNFFFLLLPSSSQRGGAHRRRFWLRTHNSIVTLPEGHCTFRLEVMVYTVSGDDDTTRALLRQWEEEMGPVPPQALWVLRLVSSHPMPTQLPKEIRELFQPWSPPADPSSLISIPPLTLRSPKMCTADAATKARRFYETAQKTTRLPLLLSTGSKNECFFLDRDGTHHPNLSFLFDRLLVYAALVNRSLLL